MLLLTPFLLSLSLSLSLAPPAVSSQAADLYERWVERNVAMKALNMMYEKSMRHALRAILIFLSDVAVEEGGASIVDEPAPHLWRKGGAADAALTADDTLQTLQDHFFDSVYSILAPLAG